MLRLNRNRVAGIVLTVIVVYLLFTSTTDSDFRRRTEEGIARKHSVLQGDISDQALLDQTNKKLQKILADKAEETQNFERPAPTETGKMKPELENLVDNAPDDVSVAGRKTMSKSKDGSKPKYPLDKIGDDQKSLNGNEKIAKAGDPGKDFARERLQEYLKKPVVIFSKSGCPHSKRAKQLLLEHYAIVPPPTVVELDQLNDPVPMPKSTTDDDESTQAPTLGRKLQDLLGEVTGRKTVPNIMVGMTSIGGNDLIWEMHEAGTLADEIRKLGGKRITSIELKKQD